MEVHTPLPPYMATASRPINAHKGPSKKETDSQGPSYRTSWRGSKSWPAISYHMVRRLATPSVPLERTTKETAQSIMEGGVKNKPYTLPLPKTTHIVPCHPIISLGEDHQVDGPVHHGKWRQEHVIHPAPCQGQVPEHCLERITKDTAQSIMEGGSNKAIHAAP